MFMSIVDIDERSENDQISFLWMWDDLGFVS